MFDSLRNSPHKPLYVALLISLCICTYVVIDQKPWKHWGGNSQRSLLAEKYIKNSASTDTDSDNDGLPDWKEVLYGANIHQKDSDGDGTSDGDEIAEGRDPTVKGPNDKLKYLQDQNFASSTTDIEGLRKEYIAKFLAAQSRAIKEDTIKKLAKGFDAKQYKENYEITDLNISQNASLATYKAYGNAFGVLIKKYSTPLPKTEAQILTEGLNGKNSRILSELQFPAIGYRAFANDLRKIEVPLPLANAHLKIINGYDVMSRGLLGMRSLLSDPINGNGAYQAYVKSRMDVTNGYAELVMAFSSQKIAFEKNEPGAPFTWPPSATRNQQVNAKKP